jgi:hypothetical protein
MKPTTEQRVLFYLLAGFVAFVLVAMLLPVSGRSASAQRVQQRRITRDRVEAAGGWGALQQDCIRLVESDASKSFWNQWSRGSISNLPPSIVALNPRSIRVDLADGGVPMLSMKLFGGHSSGSSDIPYYGLWVVCQPVTQDYTPRLELDGKSRRINRITNSIFEVF